MKRMLQPLFSFFLGILYGYYWAIKCFIFTGRVPNNASSHNPTPLLFAKSLFFFSNGEFERGYNLPPAAPCQDKGSTFQFGAKEQKQIQEVLSNCLKRKCATALNVQSIGILHHLAVPIATAVGSDTSSE
mmetsp:Transcript_51174/g.51591  ORF Transcript_51174/g.51591 Transcript_51174/m.51591 type:complete len:130 (-) Transcript_51174:91-480(-)